MAYGRFASLNESELSKLLADKDSESTKKAIKGCKAIFDEYLRQKNVEYPQDAVQLAAILKQFYAETRKQDGSQYQKGSLSAIRFGLNRHFKEILNVDITKDTEFEEANQVFIAQCVKLKKEGLAKTFKEKTMLTQTKHIPTLTAFNFRHAAPLPYELTASSVKVNANKSCYIQL